MGRQVAALVAALFAATPCLADPYDAITTPMTKFYVSIPLGANTAKERTLTYGIAMQGSRPYETINIDNRLVNNFIGPLAAIEAKWVIAGAIAAGGAYAVSRKNSDRSASYNQQQNAPCPEPGNPCGR
jgi:hypothetical protein